MEPTAVTPQPATTAVAVPAPAPDRAAFEHVLREARGGSVTLGQMLGALAARALGSQATAQAAVGTARPPEVAAAGVLPLSLDAVVQGRVSSGFGMRDHPITGERKLHAGVDIGAPAGTPIHAAGPGVVTFAGMRGGYGLLVVVDHGDGVETRYAHQQHLDVRGGDRVAAGQVLGAVGSTGLSTGPHLHFELRRDGTPVDPYHDHGGMPSWTH